MTFGGGPGAQSRRSDLNQPVRVPTGGDYGERQMLEESQRAAPLPQQPPAGQGGITAAGGITADPLALIGGAPTGRPNEAITAGSNRHAPQSMTASEVAFMMEQAARELPNVTVGFLDMLNALKKQARSRMEGPIQTRPTPDLDARPGDFPL